MKREQIKKDKIVPKKTEETVEETEPIDSAEALKESTDELLDEIDSVLEENAADFVKGYVQKGGQ